MVQSGGVVLLCFLTIETYFKQQKLLLQHLTTCSCLVPRDTVSGCSEQDDTGTTLIASNIFKKKKKNGLEMLVSNSSFMNTAHEYTCDVEAEQ